MLPWSNSYSNSPTSRTTRARNIDLRRVIYSLVKKPGAFRRYKYRDDLLSNDQFKFIWKYIDSTMEVRAACKLIVGLLYLAVKQGCEKELADIVIDLINNKKKIKLSALQDMFTTKKEIIPLVNVFQHSLRSYNELIQKGTTI